MLKTLKMCFCFILCFSRSCLAFCRSIAVFYQTGIQVNFKVSFFLFCSVISVFPSWDLQLCWTRTSTNGVAHLKATKLGKAVFFFSDWEKEFQKLYINQRILLLLLQKYNEITKPGIILFQIFMFELLSTYLWSVLILKAYYRLLVSECPHSIWLESFDMLTHVELRWHISCGKWMQVKNSVSFIINTLNHTPYLQ